MLRSQPLSQPPTGHGRTYGTDCHHKHASQSAGKQEFFSCLSKRYEEATHHSYTHNTHSSKRLLAATALHRAHNLLVVLNKQTSTYLSHNSPSTTRSLHDVVLVRSSIVRMSATVRNTNVRNHLRTVRRNAPLHPPPHSLPHSQTPTTDTQSLNKCLHSQQGVVGRMGKNGV